ncbi:unnamed protein product [Amoebophrya sp. A120]|nr:unnamed protein product [Amoebophrya sp. A120]|eukprot:GSA120T00018976001.1
MFTSKTKGKIRVYSQFVFYLGVTEINTKLVQEIRCSRVYDIEAQGQGRGGDEHGKNEPQSRSALLGKADGSTKSHDMFVISLYQLIVIFNDVSISIFHYVYKS